MSVSFFADHVPHVATLVARDALTSVPTGALCAVNEDAGIYQWDGAAWTTWRAASSDALATLSDVDLTGVADGDTLVYDSATSTWLPGAGGGGATGDASWTAATLVNSWAAIAGYNTAAFRKDGQGFVHLRGLLSGGANNTTVFTLPAGYRPAAKCHFATPGTNTSSSTSLATIEIAATGVVQRLNGPAGLCALDGLTFYAEN